MVYPQGFIQQMVKTFPVEKELHRMLSLGRPIGEVLQRLKALHLRYLDTMEALAKIYPDFSADIAAWSDLEKHIQFYCHLHIAVEKEKECRAAIMWLFEIYENSETQEENEIVQVAPVIRVQ